MVGFMDVGLHCGCVHGCRGSVWWASWVQWFSVVLCGVVWCAAVCCSVVLCDVVFGVVQY